MIFNSDKYDDWDMWVKELRNHKFNNGYKHKHTELVEYQYMSKEEQNEFRKEYLHDEIYWAKENDKLYYIIEEPTWEVYQFPLFKKKLCDMIVEEFKHFNCFLGEEQGPNKSMPYTTTDTGLDCIPGIKNSKDTPIGYFYRDIQNLYVKPILDLVWKWEPRDWYSSWVARYLPNEQAYLKPHFDSSTCASIVSLNDKYKGGGTWFERQKITIDREPGWCTIHPSQLTHRHAGRRITEGERYILVTFIS